LHLITGMFPAAPHHRAIAGTRPNALWRKMPRKLHCLQSHYKISGNARHYYGCCETEFKPVTTTITKASKTDAKEIPPNCRRLSGRLEMREETPSFNGASQRKPPLMNLGQGHVISVSPRNSPSCKQTQPQY